MPPIASALRRVCALPAAWKTREQTTIADQYPYYGQPAEAPAPRKKPLCVWTDGMPEFECAALDDLANFLGDDGWRRRTIQRGLEHMAEATDLRICGVGGYLLDTPAIGVSMMH